MKHLKLFLLTLGLPFVASGQLVTTYAGNGDFNYSGDNGPAVNAGLAVPVNIACDKLGNMYITEFTKVRRVNASGVITHFAGAANNAPLGDGGPAVDANFNIGGGGILCDAQNNVYVATGGLHRIRKINASDGIVNTIAGSTTGFSGDGGPAVNAQFNYPSILAMSADGSLYVADQGNHRIRRIDNAGIVTTIAGNGSAGSSGNGGLAINAQVNQIHSMCIDGNNNLYFSQDSGIRKIDLNTGIIGHFAGTDTATYLYYGIPATEAAVFAQAGMAVDKDNNIYISDNYFSIVRMIDGNGIIHFVSGLEDTTFRDNIVADSATFNGPLGMTMDTCGNLFIVDHGNHRVRKVSFNPGCWPLNIPELSSSSFSIHPNPTTSTITITSTNKIKQTTITDITGREVLRSGETTIDVSGLVSGVYFVRVWDVSGAVSVEKVVKE